MPTVLLEAGKRPEGGRATERERSQPRRRAETARARVAAETDAPDLAVAQGIFLGLVIALPIQAALFLAARAIWRALAG